MLVDPGLVAAAQAECWRSFPTAAPVILLDARGGNRLLVRLEDATTSTDCVLEMREDGSLVQRGGGGFGPPEARPDDEPLQVTGGGGVDNPDPGGDRWWSVEGLVGPDVTRVVIDVAEVGLVTASVAQGSFWGWFPIPPGPFHYTVRAYDAEGNLLAESPQP